MCGALVSVWLQTQYLLLVVVAVMFGDPKVLLIHVYEEEDEHKKGINGAECHKPLRMICVLTSQLEECDL